MSDDRLREVARRARETGSVPDQAALLRERLRAGELSAAQVELAAFVGDPASRLTLGEDAPPRPALTRLVPGLVAHSSQACLRALIALARRLPVGPQEDAGGHETALRAAEACALNPTDSASRETARVAAHEAMAYPSGINHSVFQAAAAFTAHYAAEAGEGGSSHFLDHAADLVEHLGGEDAAREAIQLELASWALGHGDPVLDRLQEREQGAETRRAWLGGARPREPD